MPKLFFRKKKKKAKPTIKDALTPNSAFVAVPNTPPPQSGTSQNKQKFTFSTRPEISAPIPVSTASGNSSGVTSQVGYVGSYSLVGPAGHDLSGEESEAEPGYATVRRDPVVRNPFSDSPSSLQQHQQSREDSLKTGVPLPVTPDVSSRRQDNDFQHQQSTPPSDKLPSTSELPSVTSGLSVHSDSSINSSLNSGSPYFKNRAQSSHVRTKGAAVERQGEKLGNEKQLNEAEIAAMYAKVVKNKKVVGEKKDRSPSADLPPKAPRDSPVTPRSRKGEEKSDRNREGSTSPHKRAQSSKANSATHKESRDSVRVKGKSSPKRTRHAHEVVDGPQHRGEYYYSEQVEVVEYSDEDYLPSCEDSISISENYFDEEGSADSQERMHPPASHFWSRSATLPTQHPPASEKSSSRSKSERKSKPPSRPSTAPFVGDFTSPPLPIIQPSFVQPVSIPQENQNRAFIFSETQTDGSVHYFTATPVYSPSAPTPPPNVVQPPAPSALPMAFNFPTMQYPGSVGLTESGYYSTVAQPLTSTPAGSQAQRVVPQLNTSVQSPQTRSTPQVSTHSVTNATSKAPQSQQSNGHAESITRSVTPHNRTLSPYPEEQVQTGISPSLPESITPPRSQLQNGHLKVKEGSREEATSPNNVQQSSAKLYSQMLLQFKQNEASLKAQVNALEASNSDLRAENDILQQFQKTLQQDAGDSTDRLQTQVGSLIKENDNLREQIKHNDYQLSLYKDQVSKVKAEAGRLKEENEMLLSNQQLRELEQNEWETVAEHARSVMDENVSLLKQQELQREQMKELKAEHQAIISQLRSEISKHQKDREMVERKLASLRESHCQLQDQFDALTQESAKQVTMEEHQQALEEIQDLLDELNEKNESDAKSQETQMRIFKKEKRDFVSKLTDAKAIILQVEEECMQTRKANRKTQEKIAELQYELEASRDREVVAHYQLTRAVAHAEKAMTERDTFAKIAKTQQKAIDRAERKQKQERGSLPLEGHGHMYKAQRQHYEGEIKHMRTLLARKQDHLSGLRKT